MFRQEIYQDRRTRLINYFNNGLALFPGHTESPMNYPSNPYRFRQDSTFLYLFGIDRPGLAAIIDFEHGESMLFGDDQTLDDKIWEGRTERVHELAELSGLKKAYPMSQLGRVVSEAVIQKRTIHFLLPSRSENQVQLAHLLGVSIDQLSNRASLDLISKLVEMRSAKQDCELDEIKKASEIGYEMHVTAMRLALEGRTERELAGLLEGIALSKGAQISFPVILTQNGAVLHQHHPGGQLKNGKLLLVDAGAESLLHYASDFTRTTPVGHRFSQQQLEIYELVLLANQTAQKLIMPGVKYLDIHLEVAKVIARGLKNLGLMKGDINDIVETGAHALFFPHGLGHLMGLDVHDMEDYGQVYVGYDHETRPSGQFGTAALRFGRRLQERYVITVEPGIYFIPPLIEKWQTEKKWKQFINFSRLSDYIDFGGIRIEDDVVVTRSGATLVGDRIPVNPDQIVKWD